LESFDMDNVTFAAVPEPSAAVTALACPALQIASRRKRNRPRGDRTIEKRRPDGLSS
jgi:hypothetical protein